jgi:hypothetical protein
MKMNDYSCAIGESSPLARLLQPPRTPHLRPYLITRCKEGASGTRRRSRLSDLHIPKYEVVERHYLAVAAG